MGCKKGKGRSAQSLNICGIDPARRAVLEAEREARRKVQAAAVAAPPKARSTRADPTPPLMPAVPALAAAEEAFGPVDGEVFMHVPCARAPCTDAKPIPAAAPDTPPVPTRLTEGAATAASLLLGGVGAPSRFFTDAAMSFTPAAKPVVGESDALAGKLLVCGGHGIPAQLLILESAAVHPGLFASSFSLRHPFAAPFAFANPETTPKRSSALLQRSASLPVAGGGVRVRWLEPSLSCPASFAFAGSLMPLGSSQAPAFSLPTLSLPIALSTAAQLPMAAATLAAPDASLLLRSHPLSRTASAAADDGSPPADASAEVGDVPVPTKSPKGRPRPLRSLKSALGAAAKLLAPRKGRGGDDVRDGGAAASETATVAEAEAARTDRGASSGKASKRGAAWFKNLLGCFRAPGVKGF
ncbi:hypothetical protein Rsub_02967 [Raphidocelis subcapitata]|uniref:Uncharacterized protein n=1 Tax=Raphidocelis subcapitata TaxID=307507 RepID=A0A2V0NXZ4_9CHLO|nr:hypothetical protein Rsub_02967 [Raphidocelis subcapitata]|eukprot:GBF89797.1 hypothetical protein Rsub_02967 [Raphidocelis subcapitata]